MLDFEGIARIRGNKVIEVRVKAVFDSRVNIYKCPSLKDQSFALIKIKRTYEIRNILPNYFGFPGARMSYYSLI